MTKDNFRDGRLHYAWMIVATGMLVLFACLGLGRFALGMFLPSMGQTLHLSYSQMGLISTGNFIGYMVSVFVAGRVAARYGARRTTTLGLVLVGGTMLCISRALAFPEVMLLYTVTGMGTGFANIPMMGLVSRWFFKTGRGRAAGGMISGNGMAIVLTGTCFPWVNAALGAEGWRTGWLGVALVSFIAAAVAGALLRNDPKEKGLTPLGDQARSASPKDRTSDTGNGTRQSLVHLGCIYALFGATYAVYVTFIVTVMVSERGFGENTAGQFWAVVGALSVFSGPFFGWVSDRLGRRWGLMIVFSLFTIAYALMAADLPNLFLYASVGIFGITVWSVPTIMTATVGDYVGAEQAVHALGFVTLFFGAGQITGPAVAGALADMTDSFHVSFGLCALLTGLGVLLASFLKDPGAS